MADNMMQAIAQDPAKKGIVYLRPVRPEEIAPGSADVDTSELVALHDENGNPLAVFANEGTARAAARENDLDIVTRH
ncbi:MAG: DUF1150 domain-containing protein [Neomegalonema sp.]|nr:DUF1150 domain-containing protein [Neomegalonema sp.]